LFLGQIASHKKTTGLPTFQFSTISPSSQGVIIAETGAWVCWKGILLSKIQKIKNPIGVNNMNFFRFLFFSS
jgi:hypothetical protein